jgi:hypothetical protein
VGIDEADGANVADEMGKGVEVMTVDNVGVENWIDLRRHCKHRQVDLIHRANECCGEKQLAVFAIAGVKPKSLD